MPSPSSPQSATFGWVCINLQFNSKAARVTGMLFCGLDCSTLSYLPTGRDQGLHCHPAYSAANLSSILRADKLLFPGQVQPSTSLWKWVPLPVQLLTDVAAFVASGRAGQCRGHMTHQVKPVHFRIFFRKMSTNLHSGSSQSCLDLP